MANANDLRAIAHRAMIQRRLLPDFEPAALAQMHGITGAASADDPNIRDLRTLLWASIDNDTSRDLDQLSVAEPMSDGAVKVFVAIADVDAVVKRGSPIDAHAEANTTSVYTPAVVFPMLPEQLSTDLTSLGEGVDRLAIVVEILVGADGVVKQSDVYRAFVRNRAKLAYNSVAAWLDGTAPAPSAVRAVAGLDEQLRIQDRVAHAMRSVRYQHGALSLQSLEAEVVFEGDQLKDLRPDVPNRAKELIEDFMIAANGVTAKYLTNRGLASIRRVLRVPKYWDKIVRIAAGFGEKLPADPDGEALARFLTQRREQDPARFPDLSLAVIKLLGRGEYALDLPGHVPPGHFGLAVTDYTHSTAPNRRFPDLMTQRLLKSAMAGTAPAYSNEELNRLALHCTEQETNASRVERQVRKSAAALLLRSRVGEGFDGFVTGVSEKGTWVRILHPSAEGRIVRGADGVEVGDRVRVELIGTDVERGFIDFARTEAP